MKLSHILIALAVAIITSNAAHAESSVSRFTSTDVEKALAETRSINPDQVLFSAIRYAVDVAPRTWYGEGEAPLSPEDEDARRWLIATQLWQEALMPSARSEDFALPASDRAAILLALWVEESALEYNVHAGLVSRLGTQDRGKARCMGQLRVSPFLPRADWETLAGLDADSTGRCAEWTAAAFAAQAKHCKLRRELSRTVRWTKHLGHGEAAVLFSGYGRNICAPDARHYARADRFIVYRDFFDSVVRTSRQRALRQEILQ